MQRPTVRLAALTTLVACALFSFVVATSAAPKAEEKAKSADKPAKAAAADDAPKTRLPNYFSQVLDDGQKAKVTAVQTEFAPQLAAKRAEIKSLNEKQDAAIQKIVSKEQWAKIDTLRAEARAKRLSKMAANGGKGKAKSTKTKSEK